VFLNAKMFLHGDTLDESMFRCLAVTRALLAASTHANGMILGTKESIIESSNTYFAH
jgi:hypothetical protein